ncbi:hypothetical protein HV436_01275 [Bacillus sporothermodurans]|uniref:hypothetical protein n=1 Tax=Heyndrickxia sporothermodurans TaxID=46224 RepID=UPI00192B37B4|nr:hypothetical protein [Heyndrickxia sporothermodurans]MBL5776968.1 hypothetical protein [Heyndrickxia sporothermodurans]MBL5798495.1 hypothetical protein [Heyndrickxia sporothermodurans]MBL5809412.1 hypothetical protein [Heyndrickxia sporothermodurans]MBL5813047.1 hypothetical protein [Heyndrickxia sporothermodurans]MBL5816471.1 hypothetical protein [Heyndrickxia sporothermodurans]
MLFVPDKTAVLVISIADELLLNGLNTNALTNEDREKLADQLIEHYGAITPSMLQKVMLELVNELKKELL